MSLYLETSLDLFFIVLAFVISSTIPKMDFAVKYRWSIYWLFPIFTYAE